MKMFLAIMIVFSLLGSSVVSAFDTVDLIQEHEEQNSTFNISDDETDHSLDSDHCCHGAAHFLGIFSVDTETTTPLISHSLTIFHHSLTSQAYQPPLPPPNT